MTTSSPIFKDMNCFRLNIWNQYWLSFTFQHIFGYELKPITAAANIFDGEIEKKYLGNICTQNGCSDKKNYFLLFFSAGQNCKISIK